MEAYVRPRDLDEALEALADGSRQILAGGTDYFPARVGASSDEAVLDITGISTLRTIEDERTNFRIGALATWTDLINAPLPPAFDGLKAAGREIGGVQIQNAGTVCGNVCNASPAADGVPNLLALNARVEIASSSGRRTEPIGSFLAGIRKTNLRRDELVTAILVPKLPETARSRFLKLGTRRYLVISIVMVSILVVQEAERVTDARVSVGACSPVACRLPGLEAEITGRTLGEVTVTPDHLAPLAPIDDVRASAAYRRDAAATLIRRGLQDLAV